MAADFQDIVHLLVAFFLTYALGFERALRGAGAGDRVFSMIGVGTGFAGVLAAHGVPYALTGAMTGIGFIGGGLVFRRDAGDGHEIVRGVTTAAAIFAAAGVGAAAGTGRLMVATIGAVVTLLALEIRHVRRLSVLDGRRWAARFREDEWFFQKRDGESARPEDS